MVAGGACSVQYPCGRSAVADQPADHCLVRTGIPRTSMAQPIIIGYQHDQDLCHVCDHGCAGGFRIAECCRHDYGLQLS